MTVYNEHEYICHALGLFRGEIQFCVFDLETTSKSDWKDANGAHQAVVVQIAALNIAFDHRTGRAVLLGKMNRLVRDPAVQTDADIHPKALETHHITAAELNRRNPDGSFVHPDPVQAWAEFRHFASNRTLVGQNILGFDIPLANKELARWGYPADLSEGRAIDTLPVARHLFDISRESRPFVTRSGRVITPVSKGYKLANLAAKLGVPFDPDLLHDALYDIEVCWQVWLAMQPRLRSYDARIIRGTPNQYKYLFGKLGSAWATE